MNKKILILSVLVLFLLTFVFSFGPALAQDVNLCLDGTPSFNIISQKFIDAWYSTATDVNDDNTGTKVGVYAKSMDGPFATYESIVDFSGAATVNSVNYYRYWKLHGNIIHTGYEKVSLYYSGAWHLINTRNYNSEGSGTGTITITAGGPWADVTKVKIEVYMFTQETWRTGEAEIYHYTYELRAFGEAPPTYIDIGLRVYDGAATVNIACCDPAGTETSPLKIVGTDGITYDVALVEPTDPIASGVRINTSSGIKALVDCSKTTCE